MYRFGLIPFLSIYHLNTHCICSYVKKRLSYKLRSQFHHLTRIPSDKNQINIQNLI